MQHVVTNMDVKNWTSIQYIHQHLVDQAGLKPSRGPSSEVKYCSTGGARFLLNRSFEMLEGLDSPPDGHEKWDSMACFVIGAVIRSHGFTDGKRTGGPWNVCLRPAERKPQLRPDQSGPRETTARSLSTFALQADRRCRVPPAVAGGAFASGREDRAFNHSSRPSSPVG